MSTYESMEMLGTAADRIDSLLGAMSLPLPAQMHLEQLKLVLPEIRDQLRQVYKLETGDDPWSTHPSQGDPK